MDGDEYLLHEYDCRSVMKDPDSKNLKNRVTVKNILQSVDGLFRTVRSVATQTVGSATEEKE